MAFGVRRSAFGVRRLGVRRSANGSCATNVLSRRDEMNVAWQFIAREAPQEDPPRRVRCDGFRRGLPSRSALPFLLGIKRLSITTNLGATAESYRTLRGGSFLPNLPGNKLPGYVHLVPTGQARRPGPGCLPKKANVRQLEPIAGR